MGFALLLAAPAGALDFSDLVLTYREDYTGETTFPTSPEVDLLSLGGLTANPGFAPTLTGTAARVLVTEASGQFGSQTVALNDPDIIGSGVVGVRVHFEGIALSALPVGGAAVIQIASSYAPPVGDPIALRTLLSFFRDPEQGGQFMSAVSVNEVDSLSMAGNVSSIELTGSIEETTLLGGAPFTLDLRVDPGLPAPSALGSINIDGTGDIPLEIPVSLLPEGGDFVSSSATGFLFLPEGPGSLQLEMTDFELYLAEGANLLNVDLGGFRGTPSSSYAAAGRAGVWNGITSLGSNSLYRGDGTLSPATLQVTALVVDPPGLYVNDADALFEDAAQDCAGVPITWALDFDGLENGDYEVIVYAPSDAATTTGDLFVEGMSSPALPGDASGGLIQGVSYETFQRTVDDGKLFISGFDDSFIQFCIGIAGVQLIRDLPEPSLGIGLASACALLGALRSRRRSA